MVLTMTAVMKNNNYDNGSHNENNNHYDDNKIDNTNIDIDDNNDDDDTHCIVKNIRIKMTKIKQTI